MSRRRSDLIWAAAMLAALVVITMALITDPPKETDRATFIASRLRCPVCQSESVLDSPSETAREMRTLIVRQLTEGRTSDEVFGYFVDKYGEWILLDPAPVGREILLWLLPVLFLGTGIGLIVSFRRSRSSATSSAVDNRLGVTQNHRHHEDGG